MLGQGQIKNVKFRKRLYEKIKRMQNNHALCQEFSDERCLKCQKLQLKI